MRPSSSGGQFLFALERLHDAGLPVDGDGDAVLVVVTFLDGEADGLLDAGEDHFLGNVPLAADEVHAL